MTKYNPERALQKTKREFGEHGGVAPSIARASTFSVLDSHTMPDIFNGRKTPEQGGCFLYSRHFNPTVNILSRYLAAFEGSESAMCTSSGISAIATTMLQICHMGDHIVSSNTIYGGSHALFADMFPQMGVTTTFVDPLDIKGFENAITPQTRAIFVETVANPTLKIADIPALAKIAKKNGIKLVVDNTFSPLMFNALELGADIVVYSMTKFINGASDNIAGAVCADNDFINSLMDLHTGRIMLLGPTIDPRSAYDIIQRLPHLPIRMKEHSARAIKIASLLEKLGVKVAYPGLDSFNQKGLFESMMNKDFGYGGMMTIDCKTADRADNFMNILQNDEDFGIIAVSLGYFDTLMNCSGSATSSEISEDEQRKMGLSPGLVRMAIGYTGDINDRMDQIERAVKKAGLIG